MPPVCALIHTVGVVLGNRYVPLELSYIDITGHEMHFHLKSPMSFHAAKARFPHSSPDAIMTTRGGYTFQEVVSRLWNRYHVLQTLFSKVVFGCKGNSYQMQVLRDTHLPHLLNVEKLGVPPLKFMKGPRVECPWHITPYKCSKNAVHLIARYVFQ